tara:strand:+ start:5673 stop:6341 length:669 start_codon:yes stop_codon:yes gene_type:complete
MIFAAGFGTRMQHLTKDRPKPLIKVGGKSLLDHAIGLGREAECDPIVVNLHYKADQIQRHLKGTDILTIEETPDILETGGGLRNAVPVLGRDPVITTNSDTIWSGPNPVNLLKSAWDPDKMDGLLIVVPIANTAGYDGYGDFAVDAKGQLNRGPGLVYGGVQMIKTDTLHSIKDRAFSLNILWDRMLAESKLFGLTYPGNWCDVGHPAGIGLAEKMLAENDV